MDTIPLYNLNMLSYHLIIFIRYIDFETVVFARSLISSFYNNSSNNMDCVTNANDYSWMMKEKK